MAFKQGHGEYGGSGVGGFVNTLIGGKHKESARAEMEDPQGRALVADQAARGAQGDAQLKLDQSAANEARQRAMAAEGDMAGAMALGRGWAEKGSDVLANNARAQQENAFALAQSQAAGANPMQGAAAMRNAANTASQGAGQATRDLLAQQQNVQMQGANLYAGQANALNAARQGMRGQDLTAAGMDLNAGMDQRQLDLQRQLGNSQIGAADRQAQLAADVAKAQADAQTQRQATQSAQDTGRGLLSGVMNAVGGLFDSDERLKNIAGRKGGEDRIYSPGEVKNLPPGSLSYGTYGVDPSVIQAMTPNSKSSIATGTAQFGPYGRSGPGAGQGVMGDVLRQHLIQLGQPVNTEEDWARADSLFPAEASPTVVQPARGANRASTPEEVERLNRADNMSKEEYDKDIKKQQASVPKNSYNQGMDDEYKEAFGKKEAPSKNKEEGEEKPSKVSMMLRSLGEGLQSSMQTGRGRIMSDEKTKKKTATQAQAQLNQILSALSKQGASTSAKGDSGFLDAYQSAMEGHAGQGKSTPVTPPQAKPKPKPTIIVMPETTIAEDAPTQVPSFDDGNQIVGLPEQDMRSYVGGVQPPVMDRPRGGGGDPFGKLMSDSRAKQEAYQAGQRDALQGDISKVAEGTMPPVRYGNSELVRKATTHPATLGATTVASVPAGLGAIGLRDRASVTKQPERKDFGAFKEKEETAKKVALPDTVDEGAIYLPADPKDPNDVRVTYSGDDASHKAMLDLIERKYGIKVGN